VFLAPVSLPHSSGVLSSERTNASQSLGVVELALVPPQTRSNCAPPIVSPLRLQLPLSSFYLEVAFKSRLCPIFFWLFCIKLCYLYPSSFRYASDSIPCLGPRGQCLSQTCSPRSSTLAVLDCHKDPARQGLLPCQGGLSTHLGDEFDSNDVWQSQSDDLVNFRSNVLTEWLHGLHYLVSAPQILDKHYVGVFPEWISGRRLLIGTVVGI